MAARAQRVLVVTTSFPASPGDAAGHFVAAEAEELALAGHDVHVVCPGDPKAPRRWLAHGVHVHPAGGGAAFGWPGASERLRRAPWHAFAAAGFVSQARRQVRELGPVDRLIAHWLVPSAWPIAGSADDRARVSVVLHGADVRLLGAMPSAVRRAIVRSTLARAERLDFAAHSLREKLMSALDEGTAAWLRDKSCVRPPLLRVEAPLMGSEARRSRLAARARLGRRHGERTMLVAVVGRLVKGKRPDLAARAVARLSRKASLVFVGDGQERGALTRLCEELGVEATFTGLLERKHALETLAACDVLLHTSEAEAAPNVVREARVLGVPVVACRAGDIPLWAERDSAIVMADASPEAIAAALSALTEVACAE